MSNKEENFKYDIILFNNGKYKKRKRNSKTKLKQSKVKCILYSVHSNLYGYTYITLNNKVYNKLRKMTDIKFSYKFLDGEVVDNDDFYNSDAWVKNTYFYDDARDLVAKLYEILMTEYCLNEQFWVFDAYYSYLFDKYKIEFVYKKKHYKFNSITNFYKFLFNGKNKFNKQILDEGIISLGKKYKLIPRKNILKKSKYDKICQNIKENENLYAMNSTQYTYVNPKFFSKIKSLSVEQQLYVTEFEDTNSNNILDSYIQNNILYEYDNLDITILYIIACSPLIVDRLENSHISYISYSTNNSLLEINNKKVKAKNNTFEKILNKYFPCTKFSLINKNFWG